MLRIFQWMKTEFYSVIPAIIYFVIVFNIIYFASGLILERGETRYFSPLTVTLGALIVGKVLIIANSLPFINLFPNKPLIYNIVWKFFIYNSCVVLFWIIDTFIHLHFFEHLKFEMIVDKIMYDFTLPTFWSVQITLWMAFLVFIVFHELVMAIGRDKVIKMLFG